MDVFIRRAIEEDVPDMLALVRELAAFEKEPDAVTVSLDHMVEAGFRESPVWVGWVAEQDGVMVGLAICYVRYSTWKGSVLYLEDIVVTEAMRGNGVGQLLFDTCTAFAKERGYPHMSWQVLEWNEGAIRFYKRNKAHLDPEWVNGKLVFSEQ